MLLRSLTLPTADVAALANFYGSQLGLVVIAHSATALTLRVGASQLSFVIAEAGTAPTFHFAFDVPADAVDAAADWLARAAPLLPVDGAYIAEFPNWLARSAYVRDPAGNIIECIGRRALAWPPAEVPFSARDLRGLSEIGLVVTDVPEFVAYVQRTYGLPVFARQPPTDRFAVLGGDEGLLIVVPPGRPWFPTDTLSTSFPLLVELVPALGHAPVKLRLP
ncbi:MAG: hypothetical protein H7330_15015 [Hymenobacteraceae bacterium]|nr:hypothetical protein [Hymenobacteraceae bacterium]